MVKKKKNNRPKKRNVGIYALATFANVTREANWSAAMRQAETGNYSQAWEDLAAGADNLLKGGVSGGSGGIKHIVVLKLGRQAFGSVPLVSGRKAVVSFFGR